MFSKSLKVIKIDQNMSELQQIACTKYTFNISAFAGFIVWQEYKFIITT
jgi:hypothetical protein